MEELAYAITLENADALAAMGRFNGSADTLNAKMNGMRTSAAGAGQSTQSLFEKVAHLGANLANTVAGAQALGKILEWLKGPQALTGVTSAARGAAGGAVLAGGAFGGAALGVGAFAAAVAAALPIVAAIGLAVGALSAVGSGLKLAAQFEQTNIAFKTLTGSAETAKQVIADLGSLAIDTPFSEGDLQGAAKSMLAARVPAEQLRSELTAMGNIASATGGDIGRLSTVYAQVAGKGKLYAEELQQFVEQGAGELRQAVAEQLGVTTAKLNEMMAAGQVGFSTLQGAIQRLAGEGGKWGQAMAEQSKTTLGLLSSLKDAVSKVMRLLAQPINDGPIKAVLTTAVDVATKTARVMEQAMAQGKVGEALKHSLILGAKLGVNATLDFIASIQTKAAGVLQRLSNAMAAALSGNFDAAQDLLGGFNLDTLRFDPSNHRDFFAALNKGAQTAQKEAKQTGKAWADTLDATESGPGKSKKSGGGRSDYYGKTIAAQKELDALKRKSGLEELTTIQQVEALQKELAAAVATEAALRNGMGPNMLEVLEAEKKRVNLQRELLDLTKQQGKEAAQQRKQAASMTQGRNEVLGEIAQLKALASGRKSAADEIERELRILKDKERLITLGMNAEKAAQLARQKADLQDRVDGKRSKIRGVQTADEGGPLSRGGPLSTRSGPLSTGGPLTRGGGIAGFRGRQSVSLADAIRQGQSGGAIDQFMANQGARVFDVSGQANAVMSAPPKETPIGSSGPTPELTKLDAILAELTRIRTA